MKIKTSELTGAALDWVVAKCEGKKVGYEFTLFSPVVIVGLDPYEPSEDWSQGGPIIEREKMEFRNKGHYASYNDGPTFYGETHLIAAMRCYVASKLGAEVEIPEELAP